MAYLHWSWSFGSFLLVWIIPPLPQISRKSDDGDEERKADRWRDRRRENVRFYVTSETLLLASQSLSNWSNRKNDLCKVGSVHTGSCFRHDECETSPSPTNGTGDFSVWSTSSTAGGCFFLQGNDKLEPFFLCPCVHEAWSTKQTSSTLQPGCWASPGNWKLFSGNCPLSFRLSRVSQSWLKQLRL